MADPTPNAGPGDTPPAIDIKAGGGLEGAMAALQKVFEGVAAAAKKAIGPERLRNHEAAEWLGRVAACLAETAAALRDTTHAQGKAGELAFYSEQLDAEIKGSKFEAQHAALRRRLDGVLQALGTGAAADAVAEEAAGYFRAAAGSAGSLGGEPAS